MKQKLWKYSSRDRRRHVKLTYTGTELYVCGWSTTIRLANHMKNLIRTPGDLANEHLCPMRMCKRLSLV